MYRKYLCPFMLPTDILNLIGRPSPSPVGDCPANAVLGITDGLIRVSAGIEDVEDLKEDVDYALAAL